MAMRGRPCGRRRLTRPAKLRKRIISPPRHGGKASVWRNRSAIPRAPRALFRFGNVGSFCQMPPCRASRTGRGSSTDAALLFIVIFVVFSLFFIVICGGRERRAPRAKPRGTRRNSPLWSNADIVISLLLTMPRCGSAAHNNKRTARRPPTNRARAAAPGKNASQHPRPVRRRPIHDVKQPGLAPAAMRLPCAPRGTVGPRESLRETTSNANLSSIITLRSQ
jgi:hypothetical protein